LWTKHQEKVLKHDKKQANKAIADKDFSPITTTPERAVRGIYFSHEGLARMALAAEFGDKYRKWLSNERASRATQ